MKVAIVGAGAIGGFIGTRLARAGQCQLSAYARGATLAALHQHGWRLQMGDELLQAPCHASDDASKLGVQDVLIIAVKGQSLAAVARQITPMMGPQTVILPAMNGVPWWFGQGSTRMGSEALQSVDPGGLIAATLPATQVLGCVVHASTSTPEAGLVSHKMGNGLIIGEPDGSLSPRAEALGQLLRTAGFEVKVTANIRQDIWYKLWGNMTLNPVSAITGATADRILDDQLVAEFCRAAMREAQQIGALIGCPIAETPEQRHLVTRKLGAFKSSMLQDAEGGRSLELDALVTAVREIGQRVGVATPFIDAVLGLTRLFGRVHGLYPQA
ncbi:2-dehydropantoate 2-reductase [Duganella qianjiadongensis]|uniref:2-dehydropantoate 2-reductase n=1 Tax=Duganella qianjiadongensis TaxID=2692176 RepID=A0ABW9VJG6_9BURK|nr:2-dehydropantoate 2-reductase [Duganella qianjiadongensis]MYM39741.1 2-dehydropantoate 2-reductase [Duganella qianjiadongensis]